MYKLSLPFLFTLPLTILGTKETSWQPAHMGDLTIEGMAYDKGEGPKDFRYQFTISHMSYNRTDVQDLFKWLVEATSYSNSVIRETTYAHIVKMFEDMEVSADNADNYVAALSESDHSHSNYRNYPIGVL